MEKEFHPHRASTAPEPGFNLAYQYQQPLQPPPYYPPPQQQQQPPQMIQVVQAPPLPSLGTNRSNIRCPQCQTDIQTKTNRRPNWSTHMCALPCCSWIPYYSDSFNDIEHECPNCHKIVGVFASSNGRFRLP